MRWHRGERAVQARAGLTDRADRIGPAIRSQIPPVAARFLAERSWMIIGATDRTGRTWASALTGPPGFAHVTAAGALELAARPLPQDPLSPVLDAPAKVGLIAVDPALRRRMRVNGSATPRPGGLVIIPDQTYSNCPKYIQRRLPLPADLGAPSGPAHAIRADELGPAHRRLLAAADTFFVATSDDDGNTDVSHRGGMPGFVEVLSPTRLRWPDYTGNAMFMTLGNITVNPAAGLLVPDFATGGTLQLSGTARVDWDPAHAAPIPGAERLVDFTVTDVVELLAALPPRWTAPEYSPANPPIAG